MSDSVTPWTTAHQASLSITNSWSLVKLMSIESVMPSNHFILCHPLLLLPSIFSSFRGFSNESVLHSRWPKYWGFSFSISPSNEHPGLISFRMDLVDLLWVQGTLKSLLQHHSSEASILWCSAFFVVQALGLYTGWCRWAWLSWSVCRYRVRVDYWMICSDGLRYLNFLSNSSAWNFYNFSFLLITTPSLPFSFLAPFLPSQISLPVTTDQIRHEEWNEWGWRHLCPHGAYRLVQRNRSSER